MKSINVRETTEVLNFDISSSVLNYFNSSNIINIDNDCDDLKYFDSTKTLNFEIFDFDGSYPKFKVVMDFYIYTIGDIF